MAFCETEPGTPDAVIKVKLSEYPALLEPYGSVRLGINPLIGDIPYGYFWPFMINRDGFGNFFVLDCECRHEGCVVPAYDDLQFEIRCPCHGSRYDIEGNLLAGPANGPLFKHKFTFDGNDTITIFVPCWQFETHLSILPGSPNSRVKLDFPTFWNVTYEVMFRQSVQDEWTIASFALSPTGPVDQTSLNGTGDPVSIYLNRSTSSGFYAVSMKLYEV